MISEEEKDAIELLKNIENNTWSTKYIMSSDSKNARTLINLIETQNKMIELMAKEFLIVDSFVGDYDGYTEETLIEYFRNKAKESE
jgi:hypothetical protein